MRRVRSTVQEVQGRCITIEPFSQAQHILRTIKKNRFSRLCSMGACRNLQNMLGRRLRVVRLYRN